MLLVLVRRLGNVIPTLLAVIALVFLLFSVLPGSFISGMGEDGRTTIDPAVMERMRKEMGLDDPLPERFAKYPPLPVHACPGYERQSMTSGGDSTR